PVNEVGVSELYGIDDPSYPVRDTGLKFVREHSQGIIPKGKFPREFSLGNFPFLRGADKLPYGL
ncbi:MAG: hypothetical protein GX061_00370, partial [Eubacteriaceae bacterium]|nr:hypothetical protein [Eubacteriaceae bacterium]